MNYYFLGGFIHAKKEHFEQSDLAEHHYDSDRFNFIYCFQQPLFKAAGKGTIQSGIYNSF